MDNKKHGLTEQEGDIILNESGTFISTDKLDEVAGEKKKEMGKKSDEGQISSAGPEEKDITD